MGRGPACSAHAMDVALARLFLVLRAAFECGVSACLLSEAVTADTNFERAECQARHEYSTQRPSIISSFGCASSAQSLHFCWSDTSKAGECSTNLPDQLFRNKNVCVALVGNPNSNIQQRLGIRAPMSVSCWEFKTLFILKPLSVALVGELNAQRGF